MYIKEIISREIPAVSWDESVDNVLSLMDSFGVNHLPVTKRGLYAGMVSRDSIEGIYEPGLPLHVAGPELIPLAVPPDGHIFRLIHEMAGSGLAVMPVVAEHGIYTGAVKVSDLLLALDDMLELSRGASTLVLEMDLTEYDLGDIVDIIEQENARILSVNLRRHSDEKVDVWLRINKDDLSAIISSFQRHEYDVKVFDSGKKFQDDLRDRYDELMRYLSI